MAAAETRNAREDLDSLVRQISSQLVAANGSAASAPAADVPRPNLRVIEARPGNRPELAAALEAIGRAADLMDARTEQLARTEQRGRQAEERAEALGRDLALLEQRWRASQEEAQRERTRADEVERRSAELLAKTQAMLTEASERLVAAEKRAEQAEASLTELQTCILERLRF